jgi:hypothetical protein
LVGGLVGWFGNYLKHKWDIKEAHKKDNLRDTYKDFIEILLQRFQDSDEKEKVSSKLQDYNSKILLYACPDVIQAWNNYRQLEFERETNLIESDNPRKKIELRAISQVILAMRKELDLNNDNLDKNPIVLRSLISDFDELFESQDTLVDTWKKELDYKPQYLDQDLRVEKKDGKTIVHLSTKKRDPNRPLQPVNLKLKKIMAERDGIQIAANRATEIIEESIQNLLPSYRFNSDALLGNSSRKWDSVLSEQTLKLNKNMKKRRSKKWDPESTENPPSQEIAPMEEEH